MSAYVDVPDLLSRVRDEMERNEDAFGKFKTPRGAALVLKGKSKTLQKVLKAKHGHELEAFTEAQKVAACAVRIMHQLKANAWPGLTHDHRN